MNSVLTVAQVIARFDAALQSQSYVRSGYVPELLGRDTEQLLPRAYSIAAPQTDLEDFDGREHYGDEGEAQTLIDVRTIFPLRVDGQTQDYSAALDHEHDVIRAILDNLDLTYISVAVERVTRSVLSDGSWILSLARFRVYHRYRFR